MKQGRKKTVIILSALTAACVIGSIMLYVNLYAGKANRSPARAVPDQVEEKPVETAATVEQAGEKSPAGTPNLAREEISALMDADVVSYIKDKFGNTISHGHTQIKAIEKILDYLMKQYPDDWQDRMLDFLKAAFPDMADVLYEKYNQLIQYNEWLSSNRDELARMTNKERRDALWDLRRRIFGEDAYVIWEAQLKSEQILDSLDQIAEADDRPIDEKVDLFVNSIRSAYGDLSDQFIQKRQTELMDMFLSVDSVQDNLHALPPGERKEKLVSLRNAMGMDGDALKRWDELDNARDREWTAGEQYIKERSEILKTQKGDEQNQKLHEMQDKLFGAEAAQIIRDEEAAGFYRYDHKRVYGKE